jgi:hypothetical protein
MQSYDYFHTPGNNGISPLLPLMLSPLGKLFQPSPTTGRLAFQPFFVGDVPLPLAQLSMYVIVTGYVSAGRWRLGIYDASPPADQDVYPKALVHDFGLTAAPTGAAGVQAITTAAGAGTTLVNGLYYFAAVYEGVVAATYRSLNNLCPPNTTNGTGPWLLNDHGVSGSPLGWYTAHTATNALPANAPAGMALSAAAGSPEQWNPCVFPVF